MDELVRSGLLVEFIVAATVIEGCTLWAFHRTTGRGVPLQQFGLNLLSGIALMLALREALVGAGWPWICGGLSAALLAHLADLARRWVR